MYCGGRRCGAYVLDGVLAGADGRCRLAMARPSDLSSTDVAPTLAPRGREVGLAGHEARADWGGEEVMVVAGVWTCPSKDSPKTGFPLMGYWGNSSEEPEPSES